VFLGSNTVYLVLPEVSLEEFTFLPGETGVAPYLLIYAVTPIVLLSYTNSSVLSFPGSIHTNAHVVTFKGNFHFSGSLWIVGSYVNITGFDDTVPTLAFDGQVQVGDVHHPSVLQLGATITSSNITIIVESTLIVPFERALNSIIANIYNGGVIAHYANNTLYITGNYTQQTGGELHLVNISSGEVSSPIYVAGNVFLAGAVRYSVGYVAANSTTYPILAAGGNITGQFDQKAFALSGPTTLEPAYSTHSVYLQPIPDSHHDDDSGGFLWWYYLIIAGGVVIVAIIIIVIVVVVRKRRAGYAAVPS